MKSLAEDNVKTGSFWLRHPDPTQAAVHLALQWLAYVYPASELYLEDTLRQALPYADAELNRRWRQFLEQSDVDDHVQALHWLSKTLSREQVPFLVESCWRLLLVSHDMPSHVPLALRLMARILDVPEFQILEIGQQVQREVQEREDTLERAPLLPEDPRYLDRVEWRLYGDHDPVRPRPGVVQQSIRHPLWRSLSLFAAGSVFGALLVSFLVWGPMQLGRQPVPRLSHLMMTEEADTPLISLPPPAETLQPPADGSEPEVASEPESAENDPVLSVPEPITEPTDDTAGNDSESDEEAVQAGAAVEQEPGTELDIESGIEPDIESGIEPEPVESGGVAEADEQDTPNVLMQVSASVLNVRAQPSIDSEVVMKLGEGARVWVDPDEAVGDWQQVQVDGSVGYTSGLYLEPVN